MTQRKSKQFLETFGILIGVVVFIRLLYPFRTMTAAAPYIPLVVAAVLLYVPVLHSRWRQQPIRYLDRRLADYRRSLIWFSVSFLVVMPLFFVGNHFWQGWVFKQSYQLRMIPNLWLLLLDQMFLVAIPEEFFFRGWFQTRLDQIFPARWKILGTVLGPGWLLTAAIFAVAHMVVHYQWWHFSIIFSALLFGWLREKTGSITAPALFHCFGNVVMQWIAMSYV